MSITFPKLNLPLTNLTIKDQDGKIRVFDQFRKKFVILTPEEWVRQNFLHYLIEHLGYPAGLISVERLLRSASMSFRTDAVVFNRMTQPIMLLEFKAVSVILDKKTLFQIAKYNRELEVPYLIVSNGMEHFCLELDRKLGQFSFVDEIKSWSELEPDG
ncbi:MAG: type I restriction enzyme HsdR N-terminal domain-containing protein [Vicingaceae bacterium]